MCKHGTTEAIYLQGKVVDIDACIFHEVLKLNEAGIITIASCCYHGRKPYGEVMLNTGHIVRVNKEYYEDQTSEDDETWKYGIYGKKAR